MPFLKSIGMSAKETFTLVELENTAVMFTGDLEGAMGCVDANRTIVSANKYNFLSLIVAMAVAVVVGLW